MVPVRLSGYVIVKRFVVRWTDQMVLGVNSVSINPVDERNAIDLSPIYAPAIMRVSNGSAGRNWFFRFPLPKVKRCSGLQHRRV